MPRRRRDHFECLAEGEIGIGMHEIIQGVLRARNINDDCTRFCGRKMLFVLGIGEKGKIAACGRFQRVDPQDIDVAVADNGTTQRFCQVSQFHRLPGLLQLSQNKIGDIEILCGKGNIAVNTIKHQVIAILAGNDLQGVIDLLHQRLC